MSDKMIIFFIGLFLGFMVACVIVSISPYWEVVK